MRNVLRISPVLIFAFLLAKTTGIQAQIYLNYNVNQPAVLSANAGADQLICMGGSAVLGGLPAANGGYGAYLYTWSGPDLNNASAANPIATPSVPTSYTYILTISDSLGCTALDTMALVVDTCVGIDPGAGIHAFDVFPNPNDGKFTVAVELGAAFEAVTLSVVDLNGRVIYRKELPQPSASFREQVSLAGLSLGAYFVRLEAGGQLVSRKMILR